MLTNKSDAFSRDAVVVRMLALPGETYRLASDRILHAVSGTAWITHAGRDIILAPGQRATLAAGDDHVLLSALGPTPLVLEILSDSPDRTARLTAAVSALPGA